MLDTVTLNHLTSKGITPKPNTNPDQKTPYALENYEMTMCDHMKGGIAYESLYSVINSEGDLPQMNRLFFPMDCSAFHMGKNLDGDEVIGVMFKYNGDIKGEQNPDDFVKTQYTQVDISGEKLDQITFNNSLGHSQQFEVITFEEIKGLTFQMQMLLSYDSVDSITEDLETVKGLKEFVYSNKTKTVFSYIGDHKAGQDRVGGTDIIAKQFKIIDVDQIVG